VLEKTQGFRVAVLLNSMAEDSGAESLAEHPNVDCRPERLLELSDGCACCTLAEEFAEEIVALAAQRCFDYLIVEASSIADPSAVARVLSGPALRDLVRLDALVTVVDGTGFPTELLQTIDQGPLQQVLVTQVAFATTVILNKCDLLSQQRAVDVRAALQRLNPGAAIHEATDANVPVQAVINTGVFSSTWAESRVRWFRELQQPKNAEPETPAVGMGTLLYRRQVPFHPQRFGVFLTDPGALPSLVLRAKGRVWLATRPKHAGRLSCVGARYVLSQGPAWQTVDGKAEPQSQEIVLTGSFKRQTVEEQLDACLLTPLELAQSPWQFLDEVLPPWPEGVTGAGPD
jgi:G3E family GTPase